MRIKKAVFKNWGPHKDLTLDMDAAVFGLLGPNAAGKTQIMEGLEFAFDGLLARNQATYVRIAEGEEVNNGSVDVTFVKGGVEGRIFRQVGKSPAMKLWWEGSAKPITKAAEIGKLMAQILDCDRKAIEQAVFLSQGHIADFLNKKATEREEDFAKICLIDRLAFVADIAGQEILRLSKTVTDLTSQRDEALLSREQAENALRTAESEVDLYPDRTKEIEWLNAYLEASRQALRNAELVQQAQAVVLSARERIASITAPGFLAGDPAIMLADLQRRQTEAIQAAEKLAALSREQDALKRNRERRQHLRTQVQQSLAKAPRMQSLQTELARMEEDGKAVKARKDKADELALLRNACESDKAGLAATEADLAVVTPVDEVVATEEKLNRDASGIAERSFTLRIAREVQGHVSGCCPLCRGTDLSALPSGLALEERERALADDIVALENARKVVSDSKTKRTQLLERMEQQKRQAARNSEGLLNLTEEVANMPCPFPYEQLVSMREQYAVLKQELGSLQSEMGGVQAQNAEAAALDTAIAEALPEEQAAKLMADCQELIAGAEGMEERIGVLSHYIETRAASEKDLTTAVAKGESALSANRESGEALESSKARKPAGVVLAFDAPPYAWENAKSELATKQADRDKAKGAVVANTAALRRAEHRIEEIEQRAKQNALTSTVIGYLEDLKNAFSRQGIPRHYLSKVFDSLVELTQESLANWETDFQVEKDPDNLFNFLFYRTTEPSTLLDQSQLSGGQKTRLALSFIQGVQSLLYPGLDFLCVDEPSNHLDADGVEGLARLFQTIAERSGAEAQVIVVDHNPLLQRAFSKSVTLKPFGS